MKRVFVMAWLTLGAAGSVAASDLCGATLTGDVRLDHDLVCEGDGLIVGADGIRIDLNGHTSPAPAAASAFWSWDGPMLPLRAA